LPIYNCLPDLPIEIDPKDIKKENSESYCDGIESEIKTKINDLDNEESDSDKDEIEEDSWKEEVHNMENDEEDDDDEKDEEKLVKKRKISKDTASVKFSAMVPKNDKNPQVNTQVI
jgi:hypothetical protein